MIDDFNIDELRKKFHSNLVFVENQIKKYSEKFKNKLKDYLKEDEKLLTNSFFTLNSITYKIQNGISDDLNEILSMLVNSSYYTNSSLLKNNIIKKEVKIDKKLLKELELIEEEIIFSVNKKKQMKKIDLIKKLFDSYKKSINFTITSLNRKTLELVNKELYNLNKKNSVMQSDDDLIFCLSFFNISYDKKENKLFIDDDGSIITLRKKGKETYRINENINLMIKYKKDSFAIALEINNSLVKIINIDNKNNSITFIASKKGERKGISYSINDSLLTFLENSNINDNKISSLDTLSKNIEDRIEAIEPSILGFIIQFVKNREQSKVIV